MAIVLVTGSRHIKDYDFVFDILNKEIDKDNDKVIQGGADGVDTIAKSWCELYNVDKETILPLYNTRTYLLYRNVEMIGKCDRVLAIWDNKSTGTRHTINYAKKRGKYTTVCNIW